MIAASCIILCALSGAALGWAWYVCTGWRADYDQATAYADEVAARLAGRTRQLTECQTELQAIRSERDALAARLVAVRRFLNGEEVIQS